MSKVAIVRCETYDFDAVREAVKKGIELVGGIDRFAKGGERLLLKPNILVASPPEKCVTTNPSVFKAVAEVFMTTGAEIFYGDSPAIGSTKGAAKKTGIMAAAEDMDVKLADFGTGVEIFYEKGRQNRKFVIAKGVLDSDGVISIPKLKTHGLEKFTGCVKNQFGCIPGVLKGEYHAKIPDADSFGRMLVDLNQFVNPRLYIMDGIYGMEGNGPRGGTPKRMNILLFSEDPIALDATVCRLIGLDPVYVPTTKFGSEFGAGTHKMDEIELVGDNFDDFKFPDFDIERTPIKAYTTGGGLTRFINNRMVPKPYIMEDQCIRCGVCVQMCPVNPKAVDWPDGDQSRTPGYDYGNCIRCYCCQEICPESAIKLRFPVMRRLFEYITG